LIEQILIVLTNPNIVFLLLTIGVQAILIELYSQEAGWPASLCGMPVACDVWIGCPAGELVWYHLPHHAFVLFLLDIKAPTTCTDRAGVGSLIAGALVLFNSPGVPSFQRVSVPLVVGTSFFTGLLFTGILIFALRAQKAPIRTGWKAWWAHRNGSHAA